MKKNIRLRNAVDKASATAMEYFKSRSAKLDRNDFEKKGSVSDFSVGCVYIFFDAEQNALYVGQTSHSIKARSRYQTSPHAKKDWWKHWKFVHAVEARSEVERLILELLLILAYKPSSNKRPKIRAINALFEEPK
jgi:hypothetical protein